MRQLSYKKYLVTLALLGVTILVQWVLWPYIKPAPFILFYPMIVFASLYGEALSAIWLSAFTAQWIFVPPANSLDIRFPNDVIRLGIFIGSAYLIRNVTLALSRALEKIRQSEAQVRGVLENALDAVVSMDDKGCITQWNQQAVETFGFLNSEVLGRRMSEVIIPQKYREGHEHGMKHYRKTGVGPVLNKRIEITALRKSGEEFPIELSITPIVTGSSKIFYGFIRDISARKIADQERGRMLIELEEAVRARNEFISVASHELRTPITSLKLQFQTAARQALKKDARVYEPDVVSKRIDNANRQLEHMSKLIDNMLDVTRISAGKLHLNIEKVNLGNLINDVAQRFLDQLAIVGSSLQLDLRPEVWAACDAYRFEQVFSNLFTNAIKYGAGKPVNVSLTVETGFAQIRFRDQGIGVAEADYERIFQRFERAVSINVSGLGLGLYITRQIIEAHHGTIGIESQLGEGSTFLVQLPLEAHSNY